MATEYTAPVRDLRFVLEALCEKRPTRIGLSATQKPIETIARLLVGAGSGRSEPDGRPRPGLRGLARP